MFEMDYVKNVLKQSTCKGHMLFPEIKDKKSIIQIKKSKFGAKIYEEVKDFITKSAIENSPQITYKMYKEFELTGDRSVFEKAYFERRKQLFSLVIIYLLERDKKYVSMIEEKLWQWCDLYSWELPAHFSMNAENEIPPDETVALFAAESAFFFAEIIYCIGDELDKFLVHRLKKEILRRVIDPYEKNSYWWENSRMNWSSVCAGSVGAAAIYILEDEERLSQILYRVINSMECFIDGFDEKGVTAEGLYYWGYGLSFYVYFSELLRERTNNEISLLTFSSKVKRIAELPQILQFPSGSFVNFSDSGSGKWFGDCGLFKILEKELKVDGYDYTNSYSVYFDNTYRWAVMIRRLLASAAIEEEKAECIKTGNYYFEKMAWVVDRRNVHGKFSAFAVKGGNNDEPHNHNDLGHFIFHCEGEEIFIDIGSPKYEKEYFINDKRYQYIAASSRGHSVPVINDKYEKFGKNYAARITSVEEMPGSTKIALDITNAYSNSELEQFNRKFLWSYKNNTLRIEDKFLFSTINNKVEECFITKTKPEVKDGCSIKIIQNGIEVCMIFERPSSCRVEEIMFIDINLKQRVVYRTSIVYEIADKSKLTFNIKF
ncbi:heparinase II/III domain-containing protein [Clostridium oryzae]|nr:heparinase II/III family protein [Clostridium oryzae]